MLCRNLPPGPEAPPEGSAVAPNRAIHIVIENHQPQRPPTSKGCSYLLSPWQRCFPSISLLIGADGLQPGVRACHPAARACNPEVRAFGSKLRACHQKVRSCHLTVRACHLKVRACHPNVQACHPMLENQNLCNVVFTSPNPPPPAPIAIYSSPEVTHAPNQEASEIERRQSKSVTGTF